uniref:Uncharacterized protein n=1 Tax=Amphimedon queenslandica TaxID=400682 RepID=A0A1X7T1T2_AMPQE
CCCPLKERRRMQKKTRLRNGLTASRKWQSGVDGPDDHKKPTQLPLRLEGPTTSFYKPCSD